MVVPFCSPGAEFILRHHGSLFAFIFSQTAGNTIARERQRFGRLSEPQPYHDAVHSSRLESIEAESSITGKSGRIFDVMSLQFIP